jgi:hypothetical protein
MAGYMRRGRCGRTLQNQYMRAGLFRAREKDEDI